MSLDLFLFQAIHGLAGRSGLFDWLGVLTAEYLTYLIVLWAIILILQERNWQRKLYLFALTGLSVIIARGIVTEIIRFIYARSRPFEVLNFTPLIKMGSEASFPSGHATALFALGLAIFFYYADLKLPLRKNWGTWFLSAAFLVCVARVFVGIHWPLDILIGALIGLASAVLVRKILPNHFQKTLNL